MKKAKLHSFLFVIALSVFLMYSFTLHKPASCSMYRKGVFYYHYYNGEKIKHFTITRNDTLQVETDDETGLSSYFKIRWLDSCVYEMRFINTTIMKSSENIAEQRKMILTTTILGGTSDYYLFESKANISTSILRDTIWLKKQTNF